VRVELLGEKVLAAGTSSPALARTGEGWCLEMGIKQTDPRVLPGEFWIQQDN